MHAEDRKRKRRLLFRRALQWLAVIGICLGVAVLVWLRSALYHHWVSFPRAEAACAAMRAQRQPVVEQAGWHEYRGVLHAHSALSHDCEVPLPEILRVLKVTGLDFICLSDHCVAGRADFDGQWRGVHDGKLFIPGFEMKEGLMPFGVAAGVVLSNQTDAATLARQIVEHGGVLFYAHPEEPRAWDRPELTGMEIYNIHTDFKRQQGHYLRLLPEVWLNQQRYPEQVWRLVFERPTAFLRRWDELNQTRHITGIAANDCHQNVGVRAVATASGTLLIQDTRAKTLAEYRLNWFTRRLARLCFGPLQPGRRLWQAQLDPYERTATLVNTHLLARELSEPALLEALRAGRAFVGFDSLADSSGFFWRAEGASGRAVMGERLALAPDTRLRAAAPLPCRFTVLKDGRRVWQCEGRQFEWAPTGPGKYRVEAEFKILDEWVPWVYANPIELR